MKTRILSWRTGFTAGTLLLGGYLSASSLAQTGPAADPVGPEVAAPPAAAVEAVAPTSTGRVEFVEMGGVQRAPTKPAKAGEEGKENLISITLDNVAMADVVRMFTRISGANIIAAPSNLVGRVTVNLTDVAWQPALEAILDMNGLALAEKTPGSGVFSIVPRAAGAPEPMRVETYFLKFATVDAVQPVIKSMLAQSGTLSVYASRNAIVVKSTAQNLGEIRKVVDDIDTPRDQVFLEAKFMELNDDARKDLGVDWQFLQSYGIGANSISWSHLENTQRDQSRNDTLGRKNDLSNLDQVDTRADIYNDKYQETTTTFIESPPNSGNYVPETKITPSRTITDAVNKQNTAESTLGDTFTKTITEARGAVISAADFKLLLSALKQVSGVHIVSNPKIIVANSQTAKIHIGNKEPNIKGTVTPGQQGQANTTTYALNDIEPYFDFGITVEVTPTVNTSSNITVDIKPTLTRFVSNKTAPDGTTYPITSTKEIRTIFSLESGKTAAIGGLTEATQSDTESKVPLLGDIPLIGKYLFSHSSKETVQNETVIFVTVGLAKPENILRETGLPEETQLVHKELLKSAAERRTFNAEMSRLRDAANAENAEQTTKDKAQLLKRRE